MDTITKEKNKYINDLIKKTYNDLFEIQMFYFNDDEVFGLATDVILKLNCLVEVIKNEI